MQHNDLLCVPYRWRYARRLMAGRPCQKAAGSGCWRKLLDYNIQYEYQSRKSD